LLFAGAAAFGMAPTCMPRAVACWRVAVPMALLALVAPGGRQWRAGRP
jgi:hypothetical protein